jgi:hypothetical protein
MKQRKMVFAEPCDPSPESGHLIIIRRRRHHHHYYYLPKSEEENNILAHTRRSNGITIHPSVRRD